MADPFSISVLVRTYNSEKTFKDLLAGLDLGDGDECICVDSGSTDSTLRIAAAHGCKIVIAEGPFNYSKSLNLGFRAATNPWVVVISSHCIPVVKNFIETYRREIQNFPDDVVVGYAPSTLSGKSDPHLDSEITTFYENKDYPSVSRVCGNGNTIYRKSAWTEFEFDESLKTGEDKDWVMAMIEKGLRFGYVPAARGVNRNQGSLVYMFKKAYTEGKATRKADHKPYPLWALPLGLAQLAKMRLKGEIDSGNWIRYSAHRMGGFFGSFGKQQNTVNEERKA